MKILAPAAIAAALLLAASAASHAQTTPATAPAAGAGSQSTQPMSPEGIESSTPEEMARDRAKESPNGGDRKKTSEPAGTPPPKPSSGESAPTGH